MKIAKITIRHYRSIKSLEFFPINVCALVGQNNAGKTNILSALNLVLGDLWPSRRSVEVADYFNEDTSKPIFIGLKFAPNPAGIQAISCNIPWQDDGQISNLVYLKDGKSRPLKNEYRDQCALVYLDASRDLTYHLGHSRWTLFGRIIRQLDDDFKQNASPDKQQQLLDAYQQGLTALRTERFSAFEQMFAANFGDQIKLTSHTIQLAFTSFDPLNYYKSISPLLTEHGKGKPPAQAGQGMRNMILLALFRTYAKLFRDDGIIALEEPEIYLHPHAQRSLATLFNDLAEGGSQIFYSTHSANFVDVETFDRVCLVEKKRDAGGEMTTQVRQVSAAQLLAERKKLHPSVMMTEKGLRERYRNICSLESNESFFALKLVLVEGETEEYALPIYAKALGYDFDTYGVSVINAGGKGNLDAMYQLYGAFGIATYLIFDSDKGGEAHNLILNELLLRMLGQPETKSPSRIIGHLYTILDKDFEDEMERAVNHEQYATLKQHAHQELGGKAGKGLVARYMAQELVKLNIIPTFIKDIVECVSKFGAKEALIQEDEEDLKITF